MSITISNESINAELESMLTLRCIVFSKAEEEQANFRGRTYLGPIGAASLEKDDLSDDLGVHPILPD
jgi:hypothetical protein